MHEEGEEGQRVMARIASDVTLQRLRRRLETVARVQAGEKEGQGQGWVSTGSLWGVANDYRKEGDGSLTVRLKGTLQDASVWDQVRQRGGGGGDGVRKEVCLTVRWSWCGVVLCCVC